MPRNEPMVDRKMAVIVPGMAPIARESTVMLKLMIAVKGKLGMIASTNGNSTLKSRANQTFSPIKFSIFCSNSFTQFICAPFNKKASKDAF